MAQKKVSKTAAASSRANRRSSKTGFERSAESPRFISLAGGTAAYVLVPSGRSVRASLDSDKFLAAVDELLAVEPERVVADLTALAELRPSTGWPAALATVEARIAEGATAEEAAA